MKKNQMQFLKVLNDAWGRTLSDYQSGNVIIKSERDLENALATSCKFLMQDRNIPLRIGRQETFRDKRVDIRLGFTSDPILVELKLYHDKADWKESKSMKNTVESDLRFAKGYEDTYVGIIDVIPSTQRAHLDYSLDWKEIEITKQIFNLHYVRINPATSPPRERIQKSLLVNGIMI
jgi:hypothetical protein